jgi:hypothetical protein
MSPKSSFAADLIVIVTIVVLSFLPIGAGVHFRIAVGTLRIFAGVYAVIVALSMLHLISSRTRAVLDVTAAVILAVMSYTDTFPAGNHLPEIVIYAGVSLVLFALAAIRPRGQTSLYA